MVNELLFEQLFRMYYAELCRYASRYLSDKQIVEDIVQSFFIVQHGTLVARHPHVAPSYTQV